MKRSKLKRSKHELKRLVERTASDLWHLPRRGLWLVVDEIEASGHPPSLIKVWATLHFLPAGSPFCCGEPSCHLDVSEAGLMTFSDTVRRQMGLRQRVSVEFGDRINANYQHGVSFHYGALDAPDTDVRNVAQIPRELLVALEKRVRDQVALEVDGDVAALYDFTLPKIRQERVAEPDEEPDLTKKEILDFVERVKSAEVQSISVEEFHPRMESYGDCPVALVVSRVRYNGRPKTARFRTFWVLEAGIWFSTALGKFWLDSE